MAINATREDQEKLRAFFDTLLGRRDAYAKVTVTVQRGHIAMVHVDRSYTVDQLPTATTARDDAP